MFSFPLSSVPLLNPDRLGILQLLELLLQKVLPPLPPLPLVLCLLQHKLSLDLSILTMLTPFSVAFLIFLYPHFSHHFSFLSSSHWLPWLLPPCVSRVQQLDARRSADAPCFLPSSKCNASSQCRWWSARTASYDAATTSTTACCQPTSCRKQRGKFSKCTSSERQCQQRQR